MVAVHGWIVSKIGKSRLRKRPRVWQAMQMSHEMY